MLQGFIQSVFLEIEFRKVNMRRSEPGIEPYRFLQCGLSFGESGLSRTRPGAN
jgi:hypothetical protein